MVITEGLLKDPFVLTTSGTGTLSLIFLEKRGFDTTTKVFQGWDPESGVKTHYRNFGGPTIIVPVLVTNLWSNLSWVLRRISHLTRIRSSNPTDQYGGSRHQHASFTNPYCYLCVFPQNFQKKKEKWGSGHKVSTSLLVIPVQNLVLQKFSFVSSWHLGILTLMR